MKFLIDAPLPPAVAEFLRSKGHTASHVFERGWGRLSDSAIIEAARKECAVLVTADLDFPRLISIRPGIQGGLILFRGAHWKFSAICDSLENIFGTVPDARLTSSIIVVEPSRIRIRKLRSE